MPVLDATTLQDENELGREPDQVDSQADAGQQSAETESPLSFEPMRSITLPMPEACQTRIALLIAKGSDGYFYAGFQAIRSYETSPYEQEDCKTPTLDGFKCLYEAVEDAATQAVWFLEKNSADKDENAQAAIDYLDEWRAAVEAKAEQVDIDDSIFDAEAVVVADQSPAVDPAPEAASPEPDATETTDTVSDTPATAPAVSDEAQRHFESTKHVIESKIGQLSIEQARLKAAVKANRESLAA